MQIENFHQSFLHYNKTILFVLLDIHLNVEFLRFMLFFLLHHGADPNSVDGRGDTPIAWLIKHRQGKMLLRPLRLLLRFGASVSYTDPITQNNALHLAVLATDMDYRSALLIHQVIQ
jgi:ankyrin repeat protein